MPCETLAAVVSRQHVPIILSVLHFAPRRLLLLVTQEMRREGQLETLLSSLALAGSPFPEECTTLVFLDEDKSSFEACRRLNDAFVKAGSIDVVNITSGTKPLAGALLAAAITKQVRDVIYVDADFPEAFVDQRTGKSRRFDKPIMMDVFLAAHRARSYKTLVPEEDKRKIATMFAGSDIRSFRNARAKTTDTNAEVLLAPAGQPPYDASVRKLLVDAICSLPPEERYEFVTFRWLEVFMFVLLQRCAERLGIYGLNMNLKLRWTDRPHLTNELDIAFMRNNAFWYVECKSGEFFRRTNDIDGR